MRKVYADNSSTSFPKAPGVSDAIKDFLDNRGCNVNRGGYVDSYNVAMAVFEARRTIAGMFHTHNPQEVIFTPSVTYSLNVLLQGLLRQGDHIITTSMEHNAVMRPLHALAKTGVAYDTAPCGADGSMKAADIIPLIRKETKAVVMTHASNVCGTVMPMYEVADICKAHKLRLIVDTAQTAGVLDIDAQGIDALAFTGHKGLLASQGIGGFIIKQEFASEITPLVRGGTGSLSHEIEQPGFLPDKFESGTMNIPGIIALARAIEYINQTGLQTIRDKETQLANIFIEKISNINGVSVIGAGDDADRLAIVSVDFTGRDNAVIADSLDTNYGIMTRCGLHCAPLAHKTLGTYPQGTVRFSFGHFNTLDEVDYIVQSIQEMLQKE